MTVRVSDGQADTTQSYTLRVANVNNPPEIVSTPDTTAIEDQLYEYTVVGRDADGDALTFSLEGTPGWLSIAALTDSTALLSGTPTNADVGDTSVTVRVFDGQADTTQSYTLRVANVNDSPVVSDIPDQTIDEGGSFATISLDDYVRDVDNTDVEMTWTVLGNTALTVSIDTSRVATIEIPSADWYGVETITFTATDPDSLSDSDDATFTVNPLPSAAPTGLVAVAYVDSVRLNWDANTEPDLHAYYIYRDTSSPASTLLDSTVASSPPEPFYTDVSVVHGTTYYYRITAMDSAGNESGYSDEVGATPWPYGDVSGNGQVRAFDATLILQETVGIITLPDTAWPRFTFEVANVSGDTTISAWDASLVLQYVVELISEFPVGGWPKGVASSPRKVGFSSVEQQSDGSFVVAIVIDEMSGVFSGQIEMSFDPALLRAVQVKKGEAMGDYMFVSNILEGRILMSFAGTGSGEGGGRLAEVTFESVEPGGDVLSGIRLDRVQLNEGRLEVVSVSEVEGQRIPTGYRLAQNWPNPFNAATRIRFDLPVGGEVHLVVYTLSGQRVRTLVRGERDAGTHTVVWDGRDEEGRGAASGIYFYRIEAGDFVSVRRMMLLR